MILRYLFKNTLSHPRTFSKITQLPQFCSDKITEEESDSSTQEVPFKQQRTKPYRGRDHIQGKRGDFKKGKFVADEDFPQRFVYEYMMGQKPSLNIDSLTQLREKGDLQNFEKAFQQMMQKHQAELSKPLNSYEKKLNLSVEQLSRTQYHEIKKNENSNLKFSHFVRRQAENLHEAENLLKDKKVSELIELHNHGYFQNLSSPQLCKKIIDMVSSGSIDGSLLNILYQVSPKDSFSLKGMIHPKEISKVVKLVSYGYFPTVNPLKFYWFCLNIFPELQKELFSLLQTQLTRISFNQTKFSSQIHKLTFFFLQETARNKMMEKLIQKSNSLQEMIGLWGLTVILLARIQSLMAEFQIQPNQINFNDILGWAQKCDNPLISQYFSEDLASILYSGNSPQAFSFYQNGLRYLKNQETENCYRSGIEKQNGLFLRDQFDIKYSWPGDVFPLVFTVNQNDKQGLKNFQKKSQLFKNTETMLVAAIVRGNYRKVLDYYLGYIVNTSQQQKQYAQLLKKAKSEGYTDPEDEALFILRQIARKQSYQQDPYSSLTIQLLTKTLSPKIRDNFEGKFGKIKESKQNYSPFARQEGEGQNQFFERKQQKRKGIFSKNVQNFCSKKKLDDDAEEQSKQDQEKSYEEYLRVTKQFTQEIQTSPIAEKELTVFNFKNCTKFEEVNKQFLEGVGKITEQNLEELIASYNNNIPIVGRLGVMIKYYFLKREKADMKKPDKLTIRLNSSLGSIEKDYGEYLEKTYFDFPLTEDLYQQMLIDQSSSFNRKEFKKVVAHILLHKTQISDSLIELVCQICSQQKMGVTLLEIGGLLNSRKIKISYNSLKLVCSSIQNYKNMESDLLQFLKTHAEYSQYRVQTTLFESYIKNLTFTEQYERLNDFLDILRFEVRPLDYKINPQLSSQENIESEKKFKKAEANRYNSQLFVMLDIISRSLKRRTRIPAFITEMFQVYVNQKGSEELSDRDYGVGLVINSQNQNQFLSLLTNVSRNPSKNTEYVLECGINCFLLFGKELSPHLDKVLITLVFKRKANLSEEQMKNFGLIFRELDISHLYGQFLQYCMKTQPPVNSEIKSLYYKILNNTSDDSSKNQISGYLDFIFNPTRDKERKEYKRVYQLEDKKEEMIKNVVSETKAEQTQVKVDLDDKKGKKNKKDLQKQKKQQQISKTFQNQDFVFAPKLSKKMLRNRPLRMFMSVFLDRYKPDQEGEEGKETDQKGKKKNKAGAKKK